LCPPSAASLPGTACTVSGSGCAQSETSF